MTVASPRRPTDSSASTSLVPLPARGPRSSFLRRLGAALQLFMPRLQFVLLLVLPLVPMLTLGLIATTFGWSSGSEGVAAAQMPFLAFFAAYVAALVLMRLTSLCRTVRCDLAPTLAAHLTPACGLIVAAASLTIALLTPLFTDRDGLVASALIGMLTAVLTSTLLLFGLALQRRFENGISGVFFASLLFMPLLSVTGVAQAATLFTNDPWDERLEAIMAPLFSGSGVVVAALIAGSCLVVLWTFLARAIAAMPREQHEHGWVPSWEGVAAAHDVFLPREARTGTSLAPSEAKRDSAVDGPPLVDARSPLYGVDWRELPGTMRQLASAMPWRELLQPSKLASIALSLAIMVGAQLFLWPKTDGVSPSDLSESRWAIGVELQAVVLFMAFSGLVMTPLRDRRRTAGRESLLPIERNQFRLAVALLVMSLTAVPVLVILVATSTAASLTAGVGNLRAGVLSGLAIALFSAAFSLLSFRRDFGMGRGFMPMMLVPMLFTMGRVPLAWPNAISDFRDFPPQAAYVISFGLLVAAAAFAWNQLGKWHRCELAS